MTQWWFELWFWRIVVINGDEWRMLVITGDFNGIARDKKGGQLANHWTNMGEPSTNGWENVKNWMSDAINHQFSFDITMINYYCRIIGNEHWPFINHFQSAVSNEIHKLPSSTPLEVRWLRAAWSDAEIWEVRSSGTSAGRPWFHTVADTGDTKKN